MNQRIAISHASGLIAEAILEKLPESGLASDSLVLLDEASNAGKRIAFRGSHQAVLDQQQFDLSECGVFLLLQEDAELEAAAVQQGCLVVSHLIDDPDSALFIGAGVEPPNLAYHASRLRLVGPEVACLLPALVALDRVAEITGLQATMLRSAEFHGKAGVEELASQTVNLLNARAVEARVFAQQIAFNLLPEQTSPLLAADIRRYLGNSSCSPALQTVNVPVFHGFAAALRVEFAAEAGLEDCKRALSGLEKGVLKQSGGNPISDANQSFSCVLSELEQGEGAAPAVQFWMIADPLRYGLANNYVNVVDFLLKSFL